MRTKKNILTKNPGALAMDWIESCFSQLLELIMCNSWKKMNGPLPPSTPNSQSNPPSPEKVVFSLHVTRKPINWPPGNIDIHHSNSSLCPMASMFGMKFVGKK